MVQNNHHINSQVAPSNWFLFESSRSVIVSQFFFGSLLPSTVSYSGTTRSVIDVLNQIQVPNSLDIIFFKEKKVPLEKTLVYLFTYRDFLAANFVKFPHPVQPLLLKRPVYSLSAWKWYHWQSYYSLWHSIECLFFLSKTNLSLFNEIFWRYWSVLNLVLESFFLKHIFQFNSFWVC